MMMTSNTVQGTSTSSVTTSFVATFADANVPSTHDQVTDTPNDRYMIFTTAGSNHTFTVPGGGLNCDILMIGGGGRCPGSNGGGGAGACIVAINQTLTAGTCIVWVGSGSTSSSSGEGGPSYIINSSTIKYYALGGGDGGSGNSGGMIGGCGGGAGQNFDTSAEGGGGCAAQQYVNGTTNIGPTGPTTNGLGYAVLGNVGGDNSSVNSRSGSGGGIGAAGTAGGDGGAGLNQVSINGTIYNFKTWFANGGTFGHNNNGYIGGGGAGYMGNLVFKAGGIGGGGAGTEGAANTGGGGGSNGTNNGGSGIVIIRYRTGTTTTTHTHTPTSTTTLTTTLGTPSIELVRGTQGDSNTDYKIGNYNGDFIVKSSTSNIDTDRFNITTAGNIGIGITNPAVKLQVVGGDFACSGDISAYYSDERLKTRLSNIKDPLEIIGKLNGFYYIPNDLARFYGITNMAQEIGLSAQEVNRVLPELVKIAPFDLSRDEDNNKISKSGENYLTLSYDRLAPVFVEAIKELRCSNDDLNEKYNRLLERFVNDEKL